MPTLSTRLCRLNHHLELVFNLCSMSECGWRPCAAGPSFRYGVNSFLSPDGSTIAVVTSPQADASRKVTYMYRRLANSGTRYQLVDTVSGGAVMEDPYAGASIYFQSLDANIALNPDGKFMASVEQGQLMLYQVKSKTRGIGASAKTMLDWARRCMIAPPSGYRFRGSKGVGRVLRFRLLC